MAGKEKPQSATFGGGTDQGSTHDERITNLSNRRKDARKFLQWLRAQDKTHRQDLQQAQAKIGQCANWLVFNNYYTVGETRLAGCNSCDIHLLCSFCAARRGSKYVQRYTERLAVVLKQRPALVPVMLTLTLLNGPDLEERFQHFMKSLRKLLMKRRNAALGRTTTELSKAEGGVYSVETTYSQEKGWHVHLHAVLLLNDWIDREELSREWHAITGDSFILDVRRIGNKADALDQHGEINPALVEGFAEVFKYALKFSDLDHSDRLHAWEVMRGKRLVGSWGAFRGVQVPPGPLDDLLDDLPFLRLLYRFTGKSYDLQEVSEDAGGPPYLPDRTAPVANRPASMEKCQ